VAKGSIEGIISGEDTITDIVVFGGLSLVVVKNVPLLLRKGSSEKNIEIVVSGDWSVIAVLEIVV